MDSSVDVAPQYAATCAGVSPKAPAIEGSAPNESIRAIASRESSRSAATWSAARPWSSSFANAAYVRFIATEEEEEASPDFDADDSSAASSPTPSSPSSPPPAKTTTPSSRALRARKKRTASTASGAARAASAKVSRWPYNASGSRRDASDEASLPRDFDDANDAKLLEDPTRRNPNPPPSWRRSREEPPRAERRRGPNAAASIKSFSSGGGRRRAAASRREDDRCTAVFSSGFFCFEPPTRRTPSSRFAIASARSEGVARGASTSSGSSAAIATAGFDSRDSRGLRGPGTWKWSCGAWPAALGG